MASLFDGIIIDEVTFHLQVHRVLVPEEEIRRKAHRQSVVLFVHPDNDVMVNPLLNQDAINGVNALDYLKQRLSASYKFWFIFFICCCANSSL